MDSASRRADEGLLAWIERWSPADGESWSLWRRSLSARQLSDALFPLQSALSGLLAFRHLENHPLATSMVDFRPHLASVHLTYGWALELIETLRQPSGQELSEPEASLLELERSLADARHVSERLLDLPHVDAAAFQASSDLFLRDLSRNAFFRPPEPLEFSNVAALVGPEGLASPFDGWRSDSAKTATAIAFLTLLRSHRCLGVADRQIGEAEGLARAHVLVAGVRRDLRALTHFLLVQGVESFADELEARLLTVDAGDISGVRADMTNASNELKELRDAVETVAMEIHGKVRAQLDEPLPSMKDGAIALPSERLRNGIREVRTTLKDAAKRLRHVAELDRVDGETARESERVRVDLTQDTWAFRLIVRAFLAKAAVAAPGRDDWHEEPSVAFIGEFVRHFRVFGPRLAKGTSYPHRGALTRAVSALSRRDGVDAETLDHAVRECERFAEHLEGVLGQAPQSLLAPFDKQQAAIELRGYLAAASERTASSQGAAGAFGAFDPSRAKAG